MPKLRQRYRAPVEGIKVEISEATYQRMKTVARANRCTIGQWAETTLCNYRKLGMNMPMPSRPVSATAITKTKRQFEISEAEFDAIEAYAMKLGRTARQWMAATILYALDIEVERLRGMIIEADRFG